MSDCSRLITLAKRLVSIESDNIECQDPEWCECDNYRLYTVVQRVHAQLESIPACDETASEIPDGSLFMAKFTHHLRLPSLCGAWTGYHEGPFRIVVNDVPVIEGELRGTHSFNLQRPGDDPCCEYTHGEGIMVGQATSEQPLFAQCQIIANYRTTQEIGVETDPCDPISWSHWWMSFAGHIVCPCE